MKNKETIKQLKNQINALKKQKLVLETEDRLNEWKEKIGFIPSEGSLFNMDNKEYVIEGVEEHFRFLTVKQSNDMLAKTRTYVDLTDLRRGVRSITA